MLLLSFFFFNDTATTEIYTLSLHDALPISDYDGDGKLDLFKTNFSDDTSTLYRNNGDGTDRKSTRLNSSHSQISYAVFCLKKKTTHHAVGGVHDSINLLASDVTLYQLQFHG